MNKMFVGQMMKKENHLLRMMNEKLRDMKIPACLPWH